MEIHFVEGADAASQLFLAADFPSDKQWAERKNWF